MKLSIIIPAYNEEKTIKEIIEKVKKVKLPIKKEIVVIDDCSKDNTSEILKKIKGIKVVRHPGNKNLGKGRAIRTGLKNITGDIVIVQDADLEYNPEDYNKLLEPIIKGRAEVVYGSRNLGKGKNEHSYTSFYIGGVFLSKLANLLYRIKITDEATCYKMMKADIIKNLNLKCKRFEFCPEVTAKIAKKGIKILEIPIYYSPRKMAEGKKIKWKDGVEAIWTLIKYRFVS
ncbi:glycosyltransferase family 2 protein [Candidatus Pacearchaeota archaeon]|nr:glycosyltransferase family 2 protein [Candidatus Pacearchaeota archaeon]